MNTCPACNAEVVAGKRWCSSCRANVAAPQIGRLSTPSNRLAAYVLDVMFVGLVISVSLEILGEGPTEIFLESSDRYPSSTPIAATFHDVARVLLLFLIWFFVVLLPFANGTTFGKGCLGMRVVKTDGERVGFFTMLIRELIVKYIFAIPIALGLLWIIWDKDRQGWHDEIMKTWVVEKSGETERQDQMLSQRISYRRRFFFAGLVVVVLALCIALTVVAVRRMAPAASSATPVPVSAPDREALVALYQAAEGANWRNNANWLSDAPLDFWRGVTTDESGRVIRLNLSENGLRGAIPPALSALTNLEELYLSGNRLSGSIPSELGNLTNLTKLYLFDNRLSGSIPPELGNLTNLEELYLYSNQLSGSIPSELGNLTNLTKLYLFDNRLSGSIPPELGNLTNLRMLFLSDNKLSGPLPSELGNLTNLTVLYLADNGVSGCVPESLRSSASNDLYSLGLPLCEDVEVLFRLFQATDGANWRNNANWLSDAPLAAWHGVTTDESGRVIALNLSRNGLSGAIPTELGNLTNLAELYLDGNQLHGEIPSELGRLTNLTTLSLSANELSGAIPTELGHLANLTWLVLGFNQLSGEIPTALGHLTNLTALLLYSNELSGSIPSELGNLANLTVLGLSDNQLIGSIPSELGHLANLRVLNLSGNQLSGSIPSELGQLTNLSELSLYDNQLSGPVPPELGNLTNLRRLFLGGNRLSGMIPPELGNLHKLEWLSLAGNALSGSIPLELANPHNLKRLDLRSNELSGSIPLELGHLADLERLNLSGNALGGSIPPALASLTNLVALSLSNNQLSGSIPPELGNLSNLKSLFLYNNQLSGSVPSELGNLDALENLDIGGNQLRGEIPTGPRQVLQNDLITPLAGRCIDAQAVAIGFQLEENSKTVLEYRGPLLGEFSLPTASLWGERIGNLAELAAYLDNDEVAKAAESRETNGFYRVWGRTGLTSQVVCIFRHEGWEFRINSMSGRALNVPQVGNCDPYRSLRIGVTSPAGELYHLPGLSSECPPPG